MICLFYYIPQVEVNTFVVIYVAFVNSLEDGGLSEDAGRSAGYILAFLTIVVLVFGVGIVSYAAWTAGIARTQRSWSQSSFHFGGRSFKRSFRGSKSSYRGSKSHSKNHDQNKVKENSVRASGANSNAPLPRALADDANDYPEDMGRRKSSFADELAFDDSQRQTLAKINGSADSARQSAATSAVPRVTSTSDKLPARMTGTRAQPTISAVFPAVKSRASLLNKGREDDSRFSGTIGGTQPGLSVLSDSISNNDSSRNKKIARC